MRGTRPVGVIIILRQLITQQNVKTDCAQQKTNKFTIKQYLTVRLGQFTQKRFCKFRNFLSHPGRNSNSSLMRCYSNSNSNLYSSCLEQSKENHLIKNGRRRASSGYGNKRHWRQSCWCWTHPRMGSCTADLEMGMGLALDWLWHAVHSFCVELSVITNRDGQDKT